VQPFLRSLFGQRKVFLKETVRSVTPFGGLYVLVEFLDQRGYREILSAAMPFKFRSPNSIDPSETFSAFLLSVVAGARRFAHANLLRADVALHKMVGIERFPCDDTIRNLFRRFGMKEVEGFFSQLWQWLIQRLPSRSEGYSLDLDSTVFERYGSQEGSRRGYNPRKPGRASHHPLLAVLAEANMILHGWLRSGNTGSAQGAVAFLTEALAKLPTPIKIRTLRADSGFFDQKLLSFLEEKALPYIIVARLTPWLKRQAAMIQFWKPIDSDYAMGEFSFKLYGWDRARRFIIIRERVRNDKRSLGRKLLDVPGYTFRIFVTNRSEEPLILWRDYNGRADMEKRIGELKEDLAADHFCMQEFFATEAAFRSVLFLFNLLSEFQRAADLKTYRQPATLRTQIFLCGAILGRSGHHHVLHLSLSWGGLQKRNSLRQNLFKSQNPTSPKLDPQQIKNPQPP
jgi:hypothetical protein